MKPNLFSQWFVDKVVNWSAVSMLICAFNGITFLTIAKFIPKTLFTEVLLETLLLSNLCVLIISLIIFLIFIFYAIRKYM